jgi:hypothetical protein
MELAIARQIFEKTQISNFTKKILPVGAELFHADGRMDTKLIVALRNFAKAPKNVSDRSFRQNQNKTFMFNDIPCERMSCRLCDNVEKYCAAVMATFGNMAHVHCMLDT